MGRGGVQTSLGISVFLFFCCKPRYGKSFMERVMGWCGGCFSCDVILRQLFLPPESQSHLKVMADRAYFIQTFLTLDNIDPLLF